MLADAVRLLLFPALMSFAASSDLITMTISNRVSLILIAGFFVLAVMVGMPPAAIGMHVAASAAVTPSSRPQPRYGSASISCSTT